MRCELNRLVCKPGPAPADAKAKGRTLLRDFAPSSDSSKIWLGVQITTRLQLQYGKDCKPRGRAFLYPPSLPALYELFWFHPHALSFLVAREVPFPVLRMSLFALLFRKIALPLSWIIGRLACSATRSRTFCWWKWRHELWEKRNVLHPSCKLCLINVCASSPSALN